MTVIGAWLVGLALGAELRGTVLDADGLPLAGAYVIPYDQRLLFERYDITVTDGSFRVTGIPPGRWRLRVIPPMTSNAAEEWLPDTLDLCQARTFDLAADDLLEGLEVELEEGASVSGQLLDPDGLPVDGATVAARPAEGSAPIQTRYAISAPDGTWSLRGLVPFEGPDGRYNVLIERQGFPRQLLPGVYDAVDADIVQVAPGDAIHRGPDALRRGITVAGTVRGPDGPVEAGVAHIYSTSQVVSVPIGSDGTYLAAGLPPGDVLAWASAEGFALTYYPDVDRPGARVAVPEEGQAATGVDLDLPREGRIVGRLQGQGDLSGVSLLAYNDDRTVGIGAQADPAGFFTVGRLHGGAYTVIVYAADEGYQTDFVRDDQGEPLVIDVPAEADEDVVFELVPGNRVEGTVRDLYTGAPIYGAYVFAEGSQSGQTRAELSQVDGTYAFDGLPDDRYHLRVQYSAACPNDPGWVTVYHEQVVYEPLARSVSLAGGEVVGWDPRMPPDGDHDGMDDVWEAEHGLDPALDDSAEDPDGDGFSNLTEYLLGTDPMAVATVRVCACNAPDRSSLFLWPALGGLAWLRRRKHRAPAARDQ